MTLRMRIIIIVGGAILLIGLIIAAIMVRTDKKPAPTTENPTGVIDQNNIDTAIKVGVEPTVIPKTVEVKPVTADQQDDITVKNLAKIFVERLHTYSSENNYQNIRDVETLVTAALWAKISAPLSSGAVPSTSFVSMTTQVVSIISVDVDKTTAKVELKVRKTSVANGNTSNAYGEYDVDLVKKDGGWLVSGETAK